MRAWLFWIFVAVVCIGAIKSFGQGFASSTGFQNGINPPLQYSGINWESVRTNIPNNNSGTNWQAFGV